MTKLSDLRKRGTFGSPAVDGWVEVSVEDLVAALQEEGIGEVRYEGPERCKHGQTTMHDGGEFACAGPIAEKVRVLVVRIDGEETE